MGGGEVRGGGSKFIKGLAEPKGTGALILLRAFFKGSEVIKKHKRKQKPA